MLGFVRLLRVSVSPESNGGEMSQLVINEGVIYWLWKRRRKDRYFTHPDPGPALLLLSGLPRHGRKTYLLCTVAPAQVLKGTPKSILSADLRAAGKVYLCDTQQIPDYTRVKSKPPGHVIANPHAAFHWSYTHSRVELMKKGKCWISEIYCQTALCCFCD